MKESLDRLIKEFYDKTGGTNPSVIIINPKTWDDIIEEVAILYPYMASPLDDPLIVDESELDGFWYKHIRVYRSNDVNDGLIKIY